MEAVEAERRVYLSKMALDTAAAIPQHLGHRNSTEVNKRLSCRKQNALSIVRRRTKYLQRMYTILRGVGSGNTYK